MVADEVTVRLPAAGGGCRKVMGVVRVCCSYGDAVEVMGDLSKEVNSGDWPEWCDSSTSISSDFCCLTSAAFWGLLVPW